MVSGCVGFVEVFALTFRPSRSPAARFVRKVSRIFQVPFGGRSGRAILWLSGENMPTSITLNDSLAERVATLAAEAGQPVDVFIEHLLQGLVDADIELRDGIPLFRMPAGAPVLTSEDVDRLLNHDLRP